MLYGNKNEKNRFDFIRVFFDDRISIHIAHITHAYTLNFVHYTRERAASDDMERFKVMKASGSKHSLNKYYGATAEDMENTAGLLEMTSVLGNSQIDENTSGILSIITMIYYTY